MIVLFHQGDGHALAEVVRRIDADTLDLRAHLIYPDGHCDTLEVFNAKRGEHWQELPGAELPSFETVTATFETPPELVEQTRPDAPVMPRMIAR